jgi:putative peptidoglycan lipid II flippase
VLSVGLGSAGGLVMASHLILRAFGGNHGEGAIAALGYAFRIYQVPLSLVAYPAASLLLPLVASFYMTRQPGDIAALCRQALLWGLMLLFPAAAMLWGGSELIIDVLLRRGNFDAEAVRLTGEALRGFAPAVILEACIIVFFRVFYALRMPGRTVTAAFVTLLSLVVMFMLFPQAPFAVVPLFYSASFGIAAVLLLARLISILGWNVLPAPEELVRWLASAAIAVGAAKMAAWMASGRTAQAIELSCFACVYVLAVSLLLPECRRVALAVGRETVARTAWWRT